MTIFPQIAFINIMMFSNLKKFAFIERELKMITESFQTRNKKSLRKNEGQNMTNLNYMTVIETIRQRQQYITALAWK